MAAYAALVSLMHIIQQIQNHHRPPISLDKAQVKSLTENVAFLQDFLERYPHDGSKEAADLESRIADAAYAAEDVIESHIVDQIKAGSKRTDEYIRSIFLYHNLKKVIVKMSTVKKKVMEIKEHMRIPHQLSKKSMPAGSSISPSTEQSTTVGFDDVWRGIMDKLIGGQLDRQIISIFGMGGIGKTRLARDIFKHKHIVLHFDIVAWATVYQEYSIEEILLEIICQENEQRRKDLGGKSEEELGEILYKKLIGRRYLIVMDDVWCIDVWDELNRFFAHNNNGSRILVTTRDSKVASQLSETYSFKMNLLDEDKSWDLLCENVFGEKGYPLELEGIGKKIAKNCKGLPLSIIVIGRVLANSRQEQDYWEHIAENLSSVVNLDDDEHCLKILRTSYNYLPVHLKPCFLYMGVFCENRVIRRSKLIRLWVAEGFLKPINGKSLEAVAEEYLKDLTDRNLIFIHKRGSNGRIKSCHIHHLFRDLCLREAQREKLISVASQGRDIPQGNNTQRRIAFHQRISHQTLQSLQSTSPIRSLIFDSDVDLPSLDFRLLRVLDASSTNLYDEKSRFFNSLEAMFCQLINSRYLAFTIEFFWTPYSRLFPSSLYLLWNVQTLIVDNIIPLIAPSEIWKMLQLRHVRFRSLELPDPLSGYTDGRDDFVLGNLQTLSDIKNFKCTEEVVERIPHIKKLQVTYRGAEGWSLSCFDNLDHLKLASLRCAFLSRNVTNWSDLLRNVTFPRSLKKLTLEGCQLYWEDITTKIGLLPLLEVLKLAENSTKGHEWETVEEGFPKLKFLKVGWYNDDLQCWLTESAHFPVLEHLVLVGMEKLEVIPSEVGYIPTLELIELDFCSDSAAFSAKKILKEQEDVGNEDLRVRVLLMEHNEQLESFQSHNFIVEVFRRNLPRRHKSQNEGFRRQPKASRDF